MTFRVRTINNDKQSIQVSVHVRDKGLTELRITEQDEKGVYAEASMIPNATLWREIAAAALVAAESAAQFEDINYLDQEAVKAARKIEEQKRKAQKLVDIRSYIGKTKGWTLLGYKDTNAVNELVEQGLVKSSPWAINPERTVYKLTDEGQIIHDQWVKDNTPVTPPVKTYTPATAASKTYTTPYKPPVSAATSAHATTGSKAVTSAPTGNQTKVGDKIPPYVKPTTSQPAVSGAKS